VVRSIVILGTGVLVYTRWVGDPYKADAYCAIIVGIAVILGSAALVINILRKLWTWTQKQNVARTQKQRPSMGLVPSAMSVPTAAAPPAAFSPLITDAQREAIAAEAMSALPADWESTPPPAPVYSRPRERRLQESLAQRKSMPAPQASGRISQADDTDGIPPAAMPAAEDRAAPDSTEEIAPPPAPVYSRPRPRRGRELSTQQMSPPASADSDAKESVSVLQIPMSQADNSDSVALDAVQTAVEQALPAKVEALAPALPPTIPTAVETAPEESETSPPPIH
jgi:hypothetical protein